MYCRVKRLCRDSMDTQYIIAKNPSKSQRQQAFIAMQACSQPCREEGSVLYGSMKCLPTEASQQPKSRRRKSFGHRFQSSARASCFALHWHCFLLPHTMQCWLAFIVIPARTCSYLPCSYSSHVIQVS